MMYLAEMLNILAFSLTLFSLGSARTALGPCPQIPIPPRNFDLDKYMGKWWNIYVPKKDSWFSLPLPRELTCTWTEYSIGLISNISILVEYSGDYPNEPDNPMGIRAESAYLADPEIDSGNWNFAGGKLLVLDTDYTNYAVELLCRDYFGIYHQRFASIRSRGKTIDDEMLEKILQKLGGFGFKKVDLVKVNQEGCRGDM